MAEAENTTQALMSDTKVVISEGGRIVIPASIRKAIGIQPGDSLSLRVEGNELRILSQREAVRRAQQIVRKRVSERRSLVDELAADRKREASRE